MHAVGAPAGPGAGQPRATGQGAGMRVGAPTASTGGRVVSLGIGNVSRRGILGALAFFLGAPRLTYLDLLGPSRGLYGVNLSRLMADTALVRSTLETLIAWAAAGEIDPAPGRVMALAEAGEAHRILESRGNVGKIVLRV